jgi:hypothetical protein
VRWLRVITLVSMVVVCTGIGMLGWIYEGPRRLTRKLRARGS